MSRETKVGMLVGLGVILLIGIIVSDQLSAAHRQEPAKLLTEMASKSQDGLVAKGDGSAAMNPDNRATAIPLPGEKQVVPASGEGQGVGPAVDNGSKIVMGGAQSDRVKQQLGNTAGPVLVLPANNPINAPLADAGKTHVVKQGDSLYALAKLYYKSGSPAQIALIRDANKSSLGKGDALKVGSKLVIPTQTATAAATPIAPVTPATVEPTVAAHPDIFQPASNSVTVEKGQTLAIIAAKYLGSAQRWNEIATLNKGVNPNNLKVGTKLVLPTAKSDAEARSDTKSDPKKTATPTASIAPVTPVIPAVASRTAGAAAVSPLAPTLPARMAPTTPGMPAASLPTPATPIASSIKPTL